MNWAFKRQFLYFFVFILLTGGIVFLFLRSYLNVKPTCNDKKQNGDELGIDCGGSCLLLCSFEAQDLSLVWSRAFEVVPGRYNAVAYLENSNKDSAVYKIKYKFRFSDENNVFIGKREGETFIPPRGKFVVFEPAVDLGNSIPVFTTFEFTEKPVWIKVPTEKINQLNILFSDLSLEGEESKPKFSANVFNDSFFTIPDINFIAILYNDKENAISASSTYIPKFKGKEKININFTWPKPFLSKTIKREIIPMYNVFNIELK